MFKCILGTETYKTFKLWIIAIDFKMLVHNYTYIYLKTSLNRNK